MKILLLGGGGRECALAYKLAQSPKAEKLYVAPGNAGTLQWAENAALNPLNFAEVKDFIIAHEIGMLVVGPEDPLVQGIHDYFLADAGFRDLIVVGPCREGARLEGSKEFAKGFMKRAGIPTAAYETFGAADIASAKEFMKKLNPPYVLKADGLAAGKGVLIEPTYASACAALEEMLGGKFGEASSRVVIEEFLSGMELSVFVLTDGKSYKILPEAKDYKKIGEGDTGLNTGGMGSVSPVPFADAAFMQKVEERIVKPTLAQLQKEHIPYTGFIFIGLMAVGGDPVSHLGADPYVIEYNVRMGDPETESVMPRIESDLVELFQVMGEGRLDEVELKVNPKTAACVMMVSGGYPEHYGKGYEITGQARRCARANRRADLRSVSPAEGAPLYFHAGTKLGTDGKVITSGGRVLAVTTMADTLQEALLQTYQEVEKIDFKDKYYRRDIGRDL